MEIRLMKYKNENNEEESFYPVTHAQAIVYGDDDNNLLDNIADHIVNTSNPHRVDCEQIGAAEADHTHTAEEIGAAASSHTHAIGDISGITATAAELNILDGITATTAELNYMDGVTSNVQTQLNGKAASDHTHNYAASSHNHAASEITSGTLGVARGGTGATTFTSGAALIGSGTGAVTTRAITHNTSKTDAGTSNNLATCGTVTYGINNRLNRTSLITGSDTAYTTYMARAIALVTSAPSSLTNGCCAFVYS